MTKSQKLHGSSTPHAVIDSAELDIRVMGNHSTGKKPRLTVLADPQTACVKGLVWTTDYPPKEDEARVGEAELAVFDYTLTDVRVKNDDLPAIESRAYLGALVAPDTRRALAFTLSILPPRCWDVDGLLERLEHEGNHVPSTIVVATHGYGFFSDSSDKDRRYHVLPSHAPEVRSLAEVVLNEASALLKKSAPDGPWSLGKMARQLQGLCAAPVILVR